MRQRTAESGGRTAVPDALREATQHQPGARTALAAALAAPSHAYLLAGPRGTGKRAAARAFAAELLAHGAADPDDARRRALADPSPHPDLVWLAPRGNQHLVEEVRERVIAAAAYRPFEGERRVFVVEAAEAMADESQNALLKTLEEPASFVHILLLSSEPAALLETVRSRCQPVRFLPPAPAIVERRLHELGLGRDPAERRAAARLAGSDPELAAFLVSDPGRELRALAERCARAALAGEVGDAPWRGLLAAAQAEGERAGAATRERLDSLAAESGGERGLPAMAREKEEAARRAARRARTRALDLGLALIAAWLRDLAAAAEGAAELALNADRAVELAGEAEDLDPLAARRAAELAMDARRRLRVNVSEELALESLVFRLETVLGDA